MSEELNKIGEGLGLDNVVIEDGVMKITPADAGVHLFGSLQLLASDIEDKEEKLFKYDEELGILMEENDKYRDLLEEVIPLLTDNDMVNKINAMLWRVTGITEDGTEISIDLKEVDNV